MGKEVTRVEDGCTQLTVTKGGVGSRESNQGRGRVLCEGEQRESKQGVLRKKEEEEETILER